MAAAHDAHGDQEGVLAPHQIAEASEYQRAERPHREARGKRRQRKDEAGDLVDAGEKLRADDARQQAVQIKVVPLEHRARATMRR